MSHVEGCFAGKIYAKSDNLLIHTAIFPTKKKKSIFNYEYLCTERGLILYSVVVTMCRKMSEGSEILPLVHTVYLCVWFRVSEQTVILRSLSKIAESDYSLRQSVLPSVRMGQLGSHWTDFHEILYLSILRKSVEKIQIPLKSDKNNGNFTWRPVYIFNNILLISS